MPAFHPRPDSLPEEIAVFPLTGALLLPEGRLPLNIFEGRYLNMVQDCLGAGRYLGMIQPDGSAPAEPALPPPLFRMGCLGRIASFAETEDGRLLITLVGVIRFRVAAELPLHRGYRRVRARYENWLHDLDLGAPQPPLDRAALTAALRPYFAHHGIEVNWEAIEGVPDRLLVSTLAMVCPFEPSEKQALLEASLPEERADILLALLRMGIQDGGSGTRRPS
ncbi:LON peptidase substrate-binding domain-containing protein [Roseomonas elaeocarpi]|uniref:LON peptidase substrate-binding domain-containing protein n=1 Tax=Roseomonas elaeocarpi TaxID=907779 RepID=A0ABV6JWP0_9PROT